MTQVTVTDPDLVERKTVDSSGRVYVGTAFSGDDVEVIISKKDDGGSDTVEDDEPDEEASN